MEALFIEMEVTQGKKISEKKVKSIVLDVELRYPSELSEVSGEQSKMQGRGQNWRILNR